MQRLIFRLQSAHATRRRPPPSEIARRLRRLGAGHRGRVEARRYAAFRRPDWCRKTHFARSIIQSLLTNPEDVPSPTFTLVQTYEADAAEIWHLDLYRLTDPSELSELGLEDALEDAICIIEWPDRLGVDVPQNALRLTFALDDDPDARQLTATAGRSVG